MCFEYGLNSMILTKKIVLGLNGCEESDDCLKAVFSGKILLNKSFYIFSLIKTLFCELFIALFNKKKFVRKKLLSFKIML
jgi:hypothetical protein